MSNQNKDEAVELERMETLFFRALEMPFGEERESYLRNECGSNEKLFNDLMRLLGGQDNADRLFDEVLPATITSMDVSKIKFELPMSVSNASRAIHNADELGSRVGPYTLLKKIGEGVVGNVYLAEQKTPVHRQVAVKIIKLGMDTKRVVARFEFERQALAMMEHPNVAHVLEAGETAAGRPYFVMELVHGIPITQFCDRAELDVRSRLQLFIKVCNAIQYAHQKGIIHRDIKPSNVLVASNGGEPLPKVIDFGIAKATGENLLIYDTLSTSADIIMGTPAYMSPEQAQMSKMDVDTRSDIYSLGVLLYELLSGLTPIEHEELTGQGIDAMRRLICDQEPLLPSVHFQERDFEARLSIANGRSADPRRLPAMLAGDLDCIVMQCLEKERERRYDTVEALAADIGRYLNDVPVKARAPSRLYRFGKLVRRNRSVFAASAAVLLTLIGGLGFSTYMYFKAQRALLSEAELRIQAESRESLAEAVVFINEGDKEGAARMLRHMKVQPQRPSLDGVLALRSVGEWLARQGNWSEAADRFVALLAIDQLDSWMLVSLDYQACGVSLVEAGRQDEYVVFCEDAVAWLNSGNHRDDAVGRILKICLLLPVEASTMEQLRPLGASLEQWAASKPEWRQSGWTILPLALWQYRTGAVDDACRYGLTLLKYSTSNAQACSAHAILAMAYLKSGNEELALDHTAQARILVEKRFAEGLDTGSDEYWYDWVQARILFRESMAALRGSSEMAQSEQRDSVWIGCSIFEASGLTVAEDCVPIMTVITGLEPGASYEIDVVYWSNSKENWFLQAGFDLETMYRFDREGASGSIAGTPTGKGEVDRTEYRGSLGHVVSDENGEITVFIDDKPGLSSRAERTWYDGLYVSSKANNESFYVDAFGGSNGNTVRASDGDSDAWWSTEIDADERWSYRTIGNNGRGELNSFEEGLSDE